VDKLPVLFFSRGRGRGHAVPDLAIAEELAAIAPELELQFVSYATGGETLKKARWPVTDLGLPEIAGFLPVLFEAARVIARVRPRIIIAHEEFAVLPAARQAGIPVIFVGDWFPRAGQVTYEAMAYADSIVFIEEADIFPLPDGVTKKPLFVGPVVRKMRYSLSDRARARAELKIPADATVISMIPGAFATEARAPVADLLLRAFGAVKRSNKILLWLSSRDYDLLKTKTAGQPNISIVRDCEAVDQVMVASDLVITKGNRGTIMDAASLGVPSLSISHAANPIDEVLVSRIRSNTAVNAKTTDAQTLAEAIQHVLGLPAGQREPPLNLHEKGGAAAARALADEIRRLALSSS
jgi:UDP-N-acetylglucosamine:LPS N-acetylglucosamine transferase